MQIIGIGYKKINIGRSLLQTRLIFCKTQYVTLLLLERGPEQVNGGFLGQVDGAGLLEDVPDAFDAVALQILGVLHGTRERQRER